GAEEEGERRARCAGARGARTPEGGPRGQGADGPAFRDPAGAADRARPLARYWRRGRARISRAADACRIVLDESLSSLGESRHRAEAKVIEQGLVKLNRADFAGAREAVASAAELMTVLPDDDDVKSFFVLAASELKIEYGQLGADWDQAKRVVERIKGTRPTQNRARGAFALASGDLVKAKQFLAALGDTPSADLDSTWLYAIALVYSNESARAAQVLDNALKTRGSSTRLLLVRGAVARDRGQLPEAADSFERALKGAPDNARLMVELASVRLRQNDTKGASELLNKALDTDVRKTLDAGEEARANMLRGSLAAGGHDLKNAEAAYERAVALDPNSTAVRVAYGELRLQRLEWHKAARQFAAAIQLRA